MLLRDGVYSLDPTLHWEVDVRLFLERIEDGARHLARGRVEEAEASWEGGVAALPGSLPPGLERALGAGAARRAAAAIHRSAAAPRRSQGQARPVGRGRGRLSHAAARGSARGSGTRGDHAHLRRARPARSGQPPVRAPASGPDAGAARRAVAADARSLQRADEGLPAPRRVGPNRTVRGSRARAGARSHPRSDRGRRCR